MARLYAKTKKFLCTSAGLDHPVAVDVIWAHEPPRPSPPCKECGAPTSEDAHIRRITPRSYANPHASERVVVYRSPTGEAWIPARNDMPMPLELVERGFVREECNTLADIRRVEQVTGTAAEVLHFDSNSSTPRLDELGPNGVAPDGSTPNAPPLPDFSELLKHVQVESLTSADPVEV